MPRDALTPELRRYLLGGLDEAGAAALEARYVADPALLGEIGAVEESLIDDYLDDRLAPAERAGFEVVYLASPVHRDRVAIAKAWRGRLAIREAPPRATSPGFYGWMLAAAAVVLLALWVTALPAPLPQQAQTPAAPSPPTPSLPTPSLPTPSLPTPSPPTPVPVPEPSPRPAPPQPSAPRALLALTLTPITTRGGDQSVQRLPAGPTDLRLRLEGAPLPGDTVYDAVVQTVEGRVAWRGRVRSAPSGSGLLTTLVIPAERLVPDDYEVLVTAPRGDERGRYTLRLRMR
jgi:hypothetical protein